MKIIVPIDGRYVFYAYPQTTKEKVTLEINGVQVAFVKSVVGETRTLKAGDVVSTDARAGSISYANNPSFFKKDLEHFREHLQAWSADYVFTPNSDDNAFLGRGIAYNFHSEFSDLEKGEILNKARIETNLIITKMIHHRDNKDLFSQKV
ncbi:MAG: hypothetical protein BMS9Abin31_0485 [Gammaproteobacteria bacterium]|nr:MAG: hypothetical protein BMS9Abin31_0485 [Gammaproteobacteria bacterium]